MAKGGDCRPQVLVDQVAINIWVGRDACAQAANMTKSLGAYDRISLYMSVPPFVFGTWASCAAEKWGGKASADRVHIVAEKPFGTSLENAIELQRNITGKAGLSPANLHLVDH